VDTIHSRRAPLCLNRYGAALGCFALAWMVNEMPGIFMAGAVDLLFALHAPCFQNLTVVDQGDWRAVHCEQRTEWLRRIHFASHWLSSSS
jgi:hypothetical protein